MRLKRGGACAGARARPRARESELTLPSLCPDSPWPGRNALNELTALRHGDAANFARLAAEVNGLKTQLEAELLTGAAMHLPLLTPSAAC